MRLQAEHVTLKYAQRTVLDDVSLDLQPGEKAVVYGDSGVGKSSLLKVVIGAQTPQKGTIHFDGKPLDAPGNAEVRGKLFYMPQEFKVLGDETVLEWIEFVFSFHSTKTMRPSRTQIDELFDYFRLRSELLHARVVTLSGGERQRVGLLRGILLGRPLMLLDEVTSAVDEEARRLIVDHLMSLKNSTILAVTHDSYFTQRADRRFRFAAGGGVEEESRS